MRCEDYPCCGHVGSDGPCPDFDPDTGRQLNMRCTCGAEIPLSSRFSICSGCMRRMRVEDGGYDPMDDEDYEDDDGDEDDGDDGDYEPDYGDLEFERYGYDYPSDY